MLLFFSKKNFSSIVALTAVSDITQVLYPALYKDNIKNFEVFYHDYFEDLLAPITFAKDFGFLAGVASKIFAIENALSTNCCVMIRIITI